MRRSFNPKRRLRAAPESREDLQALAALEERARYNGNPEHKRNPGDFRLTPPAAPRQGKSLCDDAQIFEHAKATALLKEGLKRGLVSIRARNGWPQNVWAVAPNGVPVEAQHEGDGSYHGYPMPEADPFRNAILARWK